MYFTLLKYISKYILLDNNIISWVCLLPVGPVVSGALLLTEVGSFSIAPPAGFCGPAHAVLDHFGLHVNEHRPSNQVCRQQFQHVSGKQGGSGPFVYLPVTLTSACSPAKEALAAGRAVHLPPRTIAADDVKQLLSHLVAALAELHRHYGHDPTGCTKATGGGAQ